MKSCVPTDLILYIPNRKVLFLLVHICRYASTETNYFIIYEFDMHLPRQRASVNRKLHVLYQTKARVKRCSFHPPNLIQFSSTLERPWSSVMSNVELNTIFLMCTLAQHEV